MNYTYILFGWLLLLLPFFIIVNNAQREVAVNKTEIKYCNIPKLGQVKIMNLCSCLSNVQYLFITNTNSDLSAKVTDVLKQHISTHKLKMYNNNRKDDKN